MGLGQLLRGLQLALALRLALQCVVLFLLDGGGDKVALRGVQAFFIGRGPFTRLRQARPAIQLGGILPTGFPFERRIGQMTVQKQALAVLGQPFVEPLPFTDQGLVRHLGAVLVQV